MLFSEETPSLFEKKFPFEKKLIDSDNNNSDNNNSDNESVGDNFQSEKTDSDSDSDTESIPEESHDSDSDSSSVSSESSGASPELSSYKEKFNKPLIHFIDHTQKEPKYTPLVINKTNSDEIIDDTIDSTNIPSTVTPTDQSTSTSTPVEKPKRAIPLGLKAFHAFAKANRASVKQSNPELTIGQIQSKLGSLWKALSNEEKTVWRSRI